MTVIQGALLTAVQAQSAGALTLVTAPATPATGTERLAGDIVGAQPAWVTVNVWPAMVIVPLRAALPMFGSHRVADVPLPVPLGPR